MARGEATPYALNPETEVAYLFANGVRLARLAYEAPGDVPSIGGETLHVFFELGDHLGSTSVVLDKATGELVERSTYQAYGGSESDYRAERWKHFREDYRFTGKEEDVEVGLIYFGKRFLNPLLNRWVSADPLAVHGLGADPNLYAYVSGRVLQAVDPLGLEGEPTAEQIQSKFGISKEDWSRATPERREEFQRIYLAETEQWRRAQQTLRDMRSTAAIEGVTYIKGSVDAASDFLMAAHVMLAPGAAPTMLTRALAEDPVGTFAMIAFPGQKLSYDTVKQIEAAEEPGDIGQAVGYNVTAAIMMVAAEVVGGLAAAEIGATGRVASGNAKVGAEGGGLMARVRGFVRRALGGGYFVAGTLVVTADGPRRIEEIREGDYVLSMPDDGDETGVPVWRRVEAAYERTTAIIDLTIEAPDGATTVIGTTHEHPFWIGGRGWVHAGDIRPDDYVWSVERGWLWVRSVHERPEEEPVYNVRVADAHTYFVSALGVWVHNTETCPPEVRRADQRTLRPTHELDSGSKVDKLAKRMKKDGYDETKPIEVYETEDGLFIRDGHHRARAAGKAGIKDVPVEVHKPLSADHAAQLFREWASTLSDKGF